MKKIAMSLMTIAAVVALSVGATGAYFSDVETSTGNTFSAGTLDLNVDGKEGTQVVHVSFANVVPAVQWQGAEYDHQWVLKNTGSVPGSITYKIKNIKNYENDCINPEAKAGDISCGVLEGELGSQLKMVFQLNQAPYGYNQDIYPLNSAENVAYTPAAYHLNAGESKNVFTRSWLINAANNNLVQGDAVEFDIEFTLNQDV